MLKILVDFNKNIIPSNLSFESENRCKNDETEINTAFQLTSLVSFRILTSAFNASVEDPQHWKT